MKTVIRTNMYPQSKSSSSSILRSESRLWSISWSWFVSMTKSQSWALREFMSGSWSTSWFESESINENYN